MSLSEPVAKEAEYPALRRALRAKDARALQRFCDAIQRKYRRRGADYRSWHLLSDRGVLLADSVQGDTDIIGRPFGGRDYFRGALAHAGQRGLASVYVSRVYRSANDGYHKFAITAPVHAGPQAGAPVVGVIAVTLSAASTLGSLRLNDGRRTAALVGRKDTNAPDGGTAGDGPPEYLLLLHPAYRRGVKEAVRVPGERIREVHNPQPGSVFRLPGDFDPAQARDPDYRDPLAGRRALAGGLRAGGQHGAGGDRAAESRRRDGTGPAPGPGADPLGRGGAAGRPAGGRRLVGAAAEGKPRVSRSAFTTCAR
jgi:hypothetical protein